MVVYKYILSPHFNVICMLKQFFENLFKTFTSVRLNPKNYNFKTQGLPQGLPKSLIHL